MITLGLGNTIPKKRAPSFVALSTVVGRLGQSCETLEALAETVTWYLSSPLQPRPFRSDELDPSPLLKVPDYRESGIQVWHERKRQSYQLAVSAVNTKRSTILRTANTAIIDPMTAESQGRLFLYEPMETVTDGSSEALSKGFFDIEDAPPWDTWFLYSEGSIICWVPEAMIPNAQAGIDANIVDCIHWCDWSKLETQKQA